MPFRATYIETLKLLGFRDGSDLLSGAFGVQLYSLATLKWLAGGAALAAVTAFCTRWIWSPPSALLLLLLLDLANGRYGFLVSKNLRGEKFSWEKFQRLGGIMIATVVLMAFVRNAINSYNYYEPAADVIFGWLLTTKLKKVISKMVALKVTEDGLPAVLMQAVKALVSSKLGPLITDATQRNAASEAAPPVPEPPTDAPAT